MGSSAVTTFDYIIWIIKIKHSSILYSTLLRLKYHYGEVNMIVTLILNTIYFADRGIWTAERSLFIKSTWLPCVSPIKN